MVRDYWEFLNKETKARVVFGVILVAVIAVIAVPYFVNVLNYHAPGVSMELPEEEIVMIEEKVEKPAKTEAEDVEVSNEEAVETEGDDEVGTETSYTYAYTGNTTPATSQPVAQASPTPKETITRTTVDDNSAGDDGYTASGIDDSSVDEDIPAEEQPTDAENDET